MRMTKLPSTWYSTVPMNKPLSLVRYNYVGACKMHTCSSGKCHTQIYHQDGGHTIGAGNTLSVVSWVMGTTNRVKGRALVILSMDATHLLMASEDSDVVGMKAVPQTPQGPRALSCVFYEQSAKYSSRRFQYGGWKMGKNG